MSQRTLQLPLRTLSRQTTTQWVCHRCLATQTTASPLPSTSPQLRLHKPASEAENYDPSLPSSQRDYRLTKTDFHLKKALPHAIPIQYLQHSTSDLLDPAEKQQREKAVTHAKIVGVVVSAGKMHKTVKVRVPGRTWNKKIGKYFSTPRNHLVHDPNSSLLAGDVVELHRLHVSTAVFHVVAAIVAPFSTPIDSRPPIPTADERLAAYKEQRFARLHRQNLRSEAAKGSADAIGELKSMGLDPGKGVEAGTNVQKSVGKVRKGAILGKKGQKLPEGVLSGGKHEVGGINQRARRNKGKAMEMEEQTQANLREAGEKEEELSRLGLKAETLQSRQGPAQQRV